MKRVWAALGLCVLAALLTGCRSTGRSGAQVARGELPEYAAVAAAYNLRVAPLDRLWSTHTSRFWYPNEKGEEENAQVEGHLQYLSPSRFSLTLEKVGELQAALGCNEREYWWIEVGEVRRARVGEQAKANAERVARLGLPVHPLDLVETLGITPLPAAGGGEEVQWSEDRKSLVITVAGRMGRRRLWVEPDTFEPSRVELLDSGGKVAVSAVLTKYERVAMPPGAPSVPRMATRVEADAYQGQKKLRVRLTLYDPLVSASRPKPKSFDLDELLKAYRINNVEHLDQPEPPRPAGG